MDLKPAVGAAIDQSDQLGRLLAQRALMQVLRGVFEHQVERQRHQDRGYRDRHQVQRDRAADDRAEAEQAYFSSPIM
jgi:hypothetical protein